MYQHSTLVWMQRHRSRRKRVTGDHVLLTFSVLYAYSPQNTKVLPGRQSMRKIRKKPKNKKKNNWQFVNGKRLIRDGSKIITQDATKQITYLQKNCRRSFAKYQLPFSVLWCCDQMWYDQAESAVCRQYWLLLLFPIVFQNLLYSYLWN